MTDLATAQEGSGQKAANSALAPNLHDYQSQSREFSWERLREELVDRADDRMNIAQLAIDRPASTTPDKLAVRFVDSNFASLDLTYGALLQAANRFANLLRTNGVRRGDVVASLLGRCPELFTTVLGTLKAGAVFSPYANSCRCCAGYSWFQRVRLLSCRRALRISRRRSPCNPRPSIR